MQLSQSQKATVAKQGKISALLQRSPLRMSLFPEQWTLPGKQCQLKKHPNASIDVVGLSGIASMHSCHERQKATVNKSTSIFNKGVIAIKDVTRYSVVIGVAQTSDNTSLLSRLKEFCEADQGQLFLPRYIWANQLNIDRATIRRWEQEIVNSKPKFAYLYYDGGKRRSKKNLDIYQRFFLALISSLKRGLITGREMNNEEVIAYLEAKDGNRPRWMGLTRQEFQKWSSIHEHHEQRQAS